MVTPDPATVPQPAPVTSPATETVTPQLHTPPAWKNGQRKITKEIADEARSLYLQGDSIQTLANRYGVTREALRQHSCRGKWGDMKAALHQASQNTLATVTSKCNAIAMQASDTVSKQVTQFLSKSLSQADELAGHGLELGKSATEPRAYGEAVRGWAVAVGQGRTALGLGEPGAGGHQGGVQINIGLLGREDLPTVKVSGHKEGAIGPEIAV